MSPKHRILAGTAHRSRGNWEIRKVPKTVLTLSFVAGLGFSHAHAQAEDGCALGAYRSPSGDLAAVTKPGQNSPLGIRYTLLDGRQGYFSQPDAVLVCNKGVVKNRGSGAGWTRLEFRETPTFFESKGVRLGVAGNALEQDQWQVDYQLKEQGFPDTILPDVHKVTDVTAKVAASDLSAHLEEVARVQKMYDHEPWFSKIDGQYSGELLRGEIARAKSESPQAPWHYTSLSAVKKLRIPQLWVLAQDDSAAPSAHTIQRLQALQKEGSNIQIFVFPHTDHGIRNYTIGANGARVTGEMVDGYLKLLADWAKGVTKPPYGASFTAHAQ